MICRFVWIFFSSSYPHLLVGYFLSSICFSLCGFCVVLVVDPYYLSQMVARGKARASRVRPVVTLE
jgi:hypothetical protein